MRRHRARAPAVVLGLGLGLPLALAFLGVGRAPAAPAVDVMARTDVQIDPVVRGYGGVTVRGQVVDRFTGQGVPGAAVSIELRGELGDERASENAGGDGRFLHVFAATEGTYDIRVEFAGSEAYAPARAALDQVDVGKDALTLHVGATASATGADITIRATRTSFGVANGVSVPIEIAAGDAALAGDRLAVVSRLQTDDDRGAAQLRLEAGQLGGPGRKRVAVRFAGDVAFNATSAETTFDLTTQTEITLTVARPRLAFEATLVATGRVVDSAAVPGAPSGGWIPAPATDGVAGAPVVLMIGTRRLGETLTDAHGNYTIRIAGEEIGAGHHNAQAIFEPSVAWRAGSHSAIASVDIAAPEPAPVSLTLLTFGATAAALLAFVGMRTRPWSAFAAKRKRDDGHRPSHNRTEPAPGLELARPSLVSTLRRAADDGFSGLVRDATSHRPIAGAALELTPVVDGALAPALAAPSGSDGGFAFEGLAAGDWRGRVTAPGYLTERFGITIPHRGELRGVRVDLLQVRERIFAMYRAAAQPLLPDPELWGIWTPRQIVDHVRRRRRDLAQSPALAALTDFVEESYFSQRTPEEDALPTAAGLVDSAVSERAGAPVATPPGRFPVDGPS